MSCYHPLLALPTGVSFDGKKSMQIKSLDFFASQFKVDPKVAFERMKKKYPDAMVVPCGRCKGCRLDHSRYWADRMMLELETSKKAIFITLTYDNAHIHPSTFKDFDPPDDLYFPYKGLERFSEDGSAVYWPEYFTLNKRDFQLFMKSLRKKFDGKEGRPYAKLRFYLGAEYGERTLRPHGHIILFGIGLSDLPGLREYGTNELGDKYYICPMLSETWMRGYVLVANVNWKTCAYVARYVMKKWSGDYAIDYQIRNCLPEFSLMSRKPGIGREYLDQHPDCLDFENINISTPEGGRKIQIPKYYLNQLKYVPVEDGIENPEKNPLYNPELYDRIMKERGIFAEDAMILKLQKTGLGYLDYLETEEKIKSRQSLVLKRSKV